MLPVCLATFVHLRRSEIAAILKNKVDKENFKLIINASRVRCKKQTIYKKRNKNKTSTRCLYIPKILMHIIELDEKRQEENKKIYKEDYINSPFLCVDDHGRPLDVDYITRNFTRVLNNFIKNETEKAKQNGEEFKFPHITLHVLRHLNISALLASGAYLTDVQDSAGHSDIQTTMHYTHHYLQGKKAIADKTDEIYRPLFKISC